MILQLKSAMLIRSLDTASMGMLDLPAGLRLLLPRGIYSAVSPGKYYLQKRQVDGFLKERGELITDGCRFYHVEIISLMLLNNTIKKPLMIKMWNIEPTYDKRASSEIHCAKFLFSDNVFMFRFELLNSPMITNTIIMQIANELAAHQDGPVNSSAVCAVGMDDSPFLIPNMSKDEISARFSSLRIFATLDQTINNLVNTFYNGFCPSEVVNLIGIVSGKIPSQTVDQYNHNGSVCNAVAENIVSTVEDTNRYDTLMLLNEIIFDHFDITISLGNDYRININQLDSMAGHYFPLKYEEVLNSINRICAEFLWRYFTITTTDKGVRYTDEIDGIKYYIDKINIKKTMDEYVTISCYTNGMVYERSFDLVLMSIMSPTINS